MQADLPLLERAHAPEAVTTERGDTPANHAPKLTLTND